MKRHALAVFALLLLSTACGRGLDDSLAGVTTSTAPPPTTSTTVAAIALTTTTTEAPPPEPLVVWAPPNVAAAIRPAADDFATALGIAVELVPIDLRTIRNRIGSEFAGPSGPDVFAGSHRWLKELKDAGIVQPVGLAPRVTEFVPVGIDAVTDGDDVYAVPYGMAATVLYRNTVLVPDAPSGFSQVKSICEALGDAIETCVAVPTDDPLPGYTFLSAPGGYLVGRTAEGGYDVADVGIDNDGARTGAELLADLVADGVVAGATTDEGVAALAGGTAAFLMAGPEAGAALPDQTPRAATALPLMAGETPVPLVEVYGFFANAAAGQSEAAGIFVREYLATAETMQLMFAAGVLAPTYAESAAALAEDDPAAAVLSSAARGVPVPSVTAIEDALAGLVPAIEALLAGPQGDDPPTPADLLAAAATSVRSALSG